MKYTFEKCSREVIKDLISDCTERQRMIFKRMYSHKNLELELDEIIDNMDSDKLDWALTQLENTLFYNKIIPHPSKEK